MNCNRAREFLALYAGGDLSDAETVTVQGHLQECEDCRHFQERLTNNQCLLRTLRTETVTSAALSQMRQGLFSRLDEARAELGWRVRLERFLLLELRRPRFAVAGAAIVAILSLTLFAQLRHVAANPDNLVAVLDADRALRLPDHRDWILVGSSSERSHPGGTNVEGKDLRQNIYMSPDAYREYKRSGTFPEGTIMVLEAKNIATLASVKDRRFDGGWGYFRFDGGGSPKALPETVGCMACHRDRAATDHVFTQFYPVLRSDLL